MFSFRIKCGLFIPVFFSIGLLRRGVDSAQSLPALLQGLEPLSLEEFGEEDEIETDRDSFTPATSVVGTGWTVLESAYTFIDNRGVPETHSYPELIVRHGICDWLELRCGWNYEVGGAGNPVSGNVADDVGEEAEIEHESQLLYGMKALLTDQDGCLPQSAFILQGYTPTGGGLTDTEMSASYIFGWTLRNGVQWDSAMRLSTASLEQDSYQVWAPSTVLKVPLGERWKGHVEYFGIFSEGREQETAQHFFSPGAHYLVTPHLEIGVRVGWGLNDQSPNFFSNAGLGLRF